MDLERDKLEADTSLELMKVSAEVNNKIMLMQPQC